MPIKIEMTGADKLEAAGAVARGTTKTLLADLFKASQKFGLSTVARVKLDYLRGPRPQKIKSEGLLKTRIQTETVQQDNDIETHVGSDVIYAAIHEYGGITHPNVTEKMRRFAWAMFFETKESKWKALALTKKDKLNVVIQSRPYIRPAIKDEIPEYQDNITKALRDITFVRK